ncbi:TPA: dihydropteroate synthase [Streptococcus equi subsp. zooepidemicus]|uniref:dihydropteroate synthase n=1 Tax=Streptococcus equi TaxID=1336 RepID=UPI001E431348|nr:dihydropteroate synthase [Streptococcus equi]MCD3416473.1 dihydropteroate synthase [Streptococcus equi subsp. zooepidemicus]HEL1145470.1 dihydropteroate synthase [Streptococcus equi subsp. zooepidemicus]HEL1147153.1 dihydropteroate synthase [Streptococcus equi subsp. zooepidemicus]HEL1535415.1 dihydropteroate synthase [Streptococcus equi subsp. zooepidemicus]
MIIRNTEFDVANKTYVMGILNVTPDSFSDGGKLKDASAAVKKALEMEKEGATIIDVGGESTRPSFTPVDVDAEIERVIPVIKKIREESDVVISVDTTKEQVALEAVKAGADIINDVSFEPYFYENEDNMVIRSRGSVSRAAIKTGAFYCLMHNAPVDYELAKLVNDSKLPVSENLRKEWISDFISSLRKGIDNLENEGMDRGKIILDPGICFSKQTNENVLATMSLKQLNALGLPVLYAASKKSFIGNILKLPVDDRMEGTLALTAYACMNGAAFVRVHDVKENIRIINMIEALKA